MRSALHQQLHELSQKLLLMAGAAEHAVQKALQSLVDRDPQLALEVRRDDRVLDALEMEVDDLAIRLLGDAISTQDLRLITIAMKISHDLERAGDEATTISRRAYDLNAEPQLKPYIDIPRMAGLALGMLKEAMESFVQRDPARARAVIPRDKEVDSLNKQLHRELASYMVENQANIARCLHLMVISKRLERIADHATNIAEEVVYLFEGKDIRHTPEAKG